MEGNLPAGEFEKLGASSSSALVPPRCTRSHGAPEWSVQDMLILVNEIIAVEGDCKNALSSYQKWTIIAENCTALGVARKSDQCRRKWDSLVTEYKMITDWEFKSHGNSYWSLDHERRKRFRLPLDFNEELYQAVDTLVKMQQERSDTDPDNDPEADFDVLDAMETGSKKSRRQATSSKGITKYGATLQTETNEDIMEGMHVFEEVHVRKAGHDSSKKTRHRATPKKKGCVEKARYDSSKKTRRQVTPQKGIPDNVATPQTTNSEGIMKEEEHVAKAGHGSSKSTSQQAIPQKEITATPQTGQGEDIMDNKHVLEKEHVEKVAHDTCKKSWRQATLQKGVTENVLVPQKVTTESIPSPQTGTSVPIMEGQRVAQEDDENATVTTEERERVLGERLLENARVIHGILAGNMTENIDGRLANLNNEEALKIEEARQKAEKLISYFEVLNRNLEQLTSVVQECHDNNS